MIEPVALEVTTGDLESLATGMNLMWALTVTFLIFYMHADFAMLEAGQVRSKNVANQLTKNMLTWAVGIGVFFVIGMGISNNVGAALGGGESSPLTMFGAGSFDWAMWLFSAVFAMTAATIVSGAVAGRAKLRAYVAYTFLLAALIYPVVAAMVWYAPGGEPILASLGFADFAGGMVVHGVGGVAGLTAAWILGARMDKYNEDGSVNITPGHSMTFAVLGTLILAFGWFGFNVGTAATVIDPGSFELADFEYVGSVAMVTALGLILYPLWSIDGTPVGEGLIAGGIVSIETAAFAPQIVGVAVITIWTVVATAAIWGALKAMGQARVTSGHERDGLDLAEHGVDTYPEFGGPDIATDGGYPDADRAVRMDGGEPTDGELRMVTAVIRPDRLGAVKQALAEVGAPSLTVTNVSGRGSQPAKKGQWRGEEYTVDLHQKVKIECVVADIPAAEVVEAIGEAANTGEPGDGKIFVMPVEDAYQVRTGKTGRDAV